MISELLTFFLSLSTIKIIIIFIILSITNGLILFPSSQVILLVAGLLSITNNINPIFFLTVIILTNILGNYWLYLLSKKYGLEFIRKYLPIKKSKLDNHLIVLNYLFKKYGNYIIIIGRNLPVFHSLISVPAGLTKIKTKTFLKHTTIGITIWSLFFFTLGIYLGNNIEKVLISIKTPFLITIIITFATLWILSKKYYTKTLKLAKQS